MATENFRSEVEVALRAPNAENLNKVLESILGMVDKLPASAKDGSKAMGEIVEQIRKMQSAFNAGGINAMASEMKALAGSLKALKVLSGGLQLFSNQEISNINKAASVIKAAAKASEELDRKQKVKRGIFGLDSQTVAETGKAIKILETEFKGLQAVIAQTGDKDVKRQAELVQKNLQNLRVYQDQLRATHQQEMERARQLRDQLTAENRQREEFFRQQELRRKANELNLIQAANLENKARTRAIQVAGDGRLQARAMVDAFSTNPSNFSAITNQANYRLSGLARWGDPDFVQSQLVARRAADENKVTKEKLAQQNLTQRDLQDSTKVQAINQQINRVKKELTAEVRQFGNETERAKTLTQDLQNLVANRRLTISQERRENPLQQKADEENRSRGMMNRVTGAGGAALLAAQAALIANYSIINQVIGSVQAGIQVSIDLEAAFRNVQAVTATTSTEMKGLEERIKSIAQTTKFTSVEVADAALILGQAGLSAKQIGEALPSVVQLAAAAGTNLAQAVDLVTSVVGVFDKKASDTADVANKITQASNSSKVSVEKLALAFQYTGNAAAQTGVTFEETLAVLAAMSNAGVKSGSTMGTGLRQFLTELQKPSEEFVSSLKRIGLSLSDIDIKSKGLIGILKTLQGAGFVAQDAIRSFDVRGAAAFNAMIANPADLDRQYQGLMDTKAAVEANVIQMDSFKSQATRLTTTMGNLVSTGIKPFQIALTATFSVVSDFLAVLGQVPLLMEGLTTAAVFFVGVGLAKHFLAIIPPLLGIMGASVATTTAMKALGASMLLAFGPVAGILVGIISVYGAFNILTENAAEKVDRLKAEVSKAKAAFDENKGAVESLTKKIETLQYAQQNLEKDQGALNRATRELNAQFGNLGLQLDVGATKFGTMISKLKELRGEMRAVGRIKLQQELDAQTALLAGNQEVLQEALVKNRQANRNSGIKGGDFAYLQSAAKSLGLLDSQNLTPSQRAKAANLLERSSSPDLSNPLAIAQLQELVSLMKTAAGSNEQSLKRIEYIERRLSPVTSAASDVARQRLEVTSTQERLSRTDQGIALDSARLFNNGGRPGTLDQVTPPVTNFFQTIREANPGMSRLEVIQAAKARAEKLLDRYDEISNTLQASGPMVAGEEEIAIRLSKLQNLKEQVRTQYLTEYKSEEAQIQLAVKAQVKLLREKANNRGLAPGQTRSSNASQRAAYLKQAADLEAGALLLGVLGRNETAEARARLALETREVQGDNLLNSAGQKEEDLKNQDIVKNLRMRASAAETRARGTKISAAVAKTWEDVDELMSQNYEYLMEARVNKILALRQEQVNLRLPNTVENQERFQAEFAALIEQSDSEIQQAQEGFTSFYKQIYTRTKRLTDTTDVNRRKIELEELKSRNEDTLFEAGSEIARIQQEIAKGIRPEGTTEQKQAALEFTKTQIRLLEEELIQLGDSTTGFIGLLVQKISESQARVNDFRRQLSDPSLTPEKRKVIEESLVIEEGAFKGLNENLSGAFKNRNRTRGEITSLQTQAYGQARALPIEQSWEALEARLDQIINNYSQTLNSIDEMGSIADGIGGMLGGATSQFSNFFSTLVDGSMSAKNAFRSFAGSIIKSLLDIAAQALALSVLKSILGMFGFGNFSPVGGTGITPGTGGFGLKLPGAATGGIVTGGVAGKDSVPVLTMPGEGILNTKAMQAVGSDFVHSLNKKGSAALGSVSAGNKKGDVVNIYLLPKDEQPAGLGPKDVIMVISNDLMTNGPTKTLVKQISLGNM